MLDIVLVTYNSEKWISNCLDAISSSTYPAECIYITVVDNGSTDNTAFILKKYQNEKLKQFQILFQKENLGFGKANNVGVRHTSQELVFFLNIDTEVAPDAIAELMNAVQTSSPDVALWESRQFPYEHPKRYNPVTLDVSWASGACMLVRRDAFLEIGMFDENIFMYGEDVDLSWRLRHKGYKLRYVPKSVVFHYTYDNANQVKETQFYNSVYVNLMLRYKFGTALDVMKGYVLMLGLLGIGGPSTKHHAITLSQIYRSFGEGRVFRAWRGKQNVGSSFLPSFKLWDYEVNREGAFYFHKKVEEFPLVSILIRTCNRPQMLREALISCRNQTYPNLEIVIVEDGEPKSKTLIQSEFHDLNIVYTATGTRVGRCNAGNIALQMASGEWFNFLDDDDLLFADHIEVLVRGVTEQRGTAAAYSTSFEVPTKILSLDPYRYEEHLYFVQHKQPFDLATLIHHNYFPIQTVLFNRSLYEELGGFDPNLEVLEDWDLWLRYASHRPFFFVDKLTSLYRVPAEGHTNSERQRLLDSYLDIVRRKHMNEYVNVTFRELFELYEIKFSKQFSSRLRAVGPRVLLHKVKKKIYRQIKRVLS
ncbi:glycosyltransferase family 2 protein [Paenibacillus sp. B01]|uniref:glycosyltransferase family 2 protein n=1 Tax=Paenibacillus sp. B01 TaxID=2660554 RepID=UPI001E34116F|nr:glycosyltransferase family 2 protein [Paenibacillus sp. B01]